VNDQGNNEPIIRIENVSKRFKQVQALSNVSLTVERGEVVIVVGPSGSGKSTLLRCINHLEPVDDGRIIVDGTPLTGKATDINKVRAEVGMVFQLFNLFPHLTALENITPRPSGWCGNETHSNAPRSPTTCSRKWVSPKRPPATPASFPVANSNGWRLPERWP